MNDQVDILMGTYNGEQYVLEQILSILSQTYPHIHLIIRDDCSTDSTQKILLNLQKEHPNRITLIESTKRLGVKANFSTLMEHSKASYIMLSDQDDIWKPFKVEVTLLKMKELEEQNPTESPLLVYTDLHVVDSNLNTIHPSLWEFSQINPERNQLNHVLVSNVVTGCTLMMNRALLKKSLPIPPESMMHDWWIALVTAVSGKMGIVHESTIKYRQHGRNTVGAHARNLTWILKKIGGVLSNPKSQQKIPQAKAVLNRYSCDLSSKDALTLKVFIDMPNQSFIRKRINMIRYGLLTHGALWNAVLILLGRPYR